MKYLLVFLLSLFLFSCWTETEVSVTEETTEIVNDYVDTLEWSIKDAKEVRDIMNLNNSNLENELNSIY